jgi:hypothetical protein
VAEVFPAALVELTPLVAIGAVIDVKAAGPDIEVLLLLLLLLSTFNSLLSTGAADSFWESRFGMWQSKPP